MRTALAGDDWRPGFAKRAPNFDAVCAQDAAADLGQETHLGHSPVTLGGGAFQIGAGRMDEFDLFGVPA